MSIPLIDLTNQYYELKEESDALWFDVMEHASFIGGSKVESLEQEIAEYVGTKYCVACANGTDALFLIMEALGITRGDEVITTPWTFFATIECITHLGAKPIMVDIDPRSYNIDPDAIEAAITDKTKAIIPVHIYGQCCDMDAINDIAKRHDLIVIEDACQALGAKYKGKMAGSLSRAAAFSFFPTKNLGCAGDGGCITTDDKKLADRCNLVAKHGMPVKYKHVTFGTNSRLDALQAGLLSLRLTKLDEWNAQRAHAAAYYDKELYGVGDLIAPHKEEFSSHIYHLYILKTDRAVELQEYLVGNGIGSALYYPMSLHEQECFDHLPGFTRPSLPVAEGCSNKTVAIPAYPGISEEQLAEVVCAIKAFFE
jgi:dTDP-4-amino-4,6-dideoxygalactose transaminase